jgi:hypothetical protein
VTLNDESELGAGQYGCSEDFTFLLQVPLSDALVHLFSDEMGILCSLSALPLIPCLGVGSLALLSELLPYVRRLSSSCSRLMLFLIQSSLTY